MPISVKSGGSSISQSSSSSGISVCDSAMFTLSGGKPWAICLYAPGGFFWTHQPQPSSGWGFSSWSGLGSGSLTSSCLDENGTEFCGSGSTVGSAMTSGAFGWGAGALLGAFVLLVEGWRTSSLSPLVHCIACSNVDIVICNYVTLVEYNVVLNNDGALLQPINLVALWL